MSPPRFLAAWLALAATGTLALGIVAAREAAERARLERDLAGTREEIRVRLGQAERHRDRVVVRAPFATWAHLVAGLHEAAATSRLDRFRYVTLGVVPVTDPGAPLPTADKGDHGETSRDGDTGGEKEGARGERRDRAPATAPYRAMRARVEGGGTYGQIVSFVRALAAVDPPLQLDRIVLRAGPEGPTFEATVHLVTALPVESPRVVTLDRLPAAEPPGDLGAALAGLVPAGAAPAPAEVAR